MRNFLETFWGLILTYMLQIYRESNANYYGGTDMPNIKPISDLRSYTAVINDVAYGNRVYLTYNGHGQCATIDMKELDELDKQKALYQLMRN